MTPSLTPLSLRANISYVMKPFLQTPPTAPEAVIFSHHSITTSFLYMLLYLCQENGGSQRTNLIFLCSPPYPWGLEYTQYVIAKHSLNECREIKGRHLEMRKKKGNQSGEVQTEEVSRSLPPANPVSFHLRLTCFPTTARRPRPPWDLLSAPRQPQSPTSSNKSSSSWDLSHA